MARNITVTNLVLAIRERADQVGSSFVSDAEIIRMISASWGELYMLLVKAYPERFMLEQVITADGVDGNYAVEATYLATLGVSYRRSATSGQWPLARLGLSEIPLWQNQTGRALRYAVVGSNVALFPNPPNGQVYVHVYLPVPVNLSVGTESIDGEAAWEQFIVCDVAGKIAQKEESEHRGHFAERDRIRARIEEEALMREVLEPRRVEGVADQYFDDAEIWPYGNRSGW